MAYRTPLQPQSRRKALLMRLLWGNMLKNYSLYGAGESVKRLVGAEDFIALVVQRIIPGSALVDDASAETGFETVEPIKRVVRVFSGRNRTQVILQAPFGPCKLYGRPMELRKATIKFLFSLAEAPKQIGCRPAGNHDNGAGKQVRAVSGEKKQNLA